MPNARPPAPNRTRYARQMATKMETNARLFHDLRRPVTPNRRAIAWNIERMKRMVKASHAPSRQILLFNRTLLRVEKNIYGLQALTQALYRGHYTPKQVFIDTMKGHLELQQLKGANSLAETLQQISEKDVRIRVDWMGPHFIISKDYYTPLSRVVHANESFSGIALQSKALVVNTPGGRKKITHFPFSITLIEKDASPSPTMNHERWHDFERVSNAIKSSSVDPATEYLSPSAMQLRLGGWFQNELSATIYGSASVELEQHFPKRIKSFFQSVRAKMRANPAFKKWKKQDWWGLATLQDDFLRITRAVQSNWIRPRVTKVDPFDIHRRTSLETLPTAEAATRMRIKQYAMERTRGIQFSSMLLATLVSTTPLHEIENQLALFANTNHFDGPGLPYRRFPRKY